MYTFFFSNILVFVFLNIYISLVTNLGYKWNKDFRDRNKDKDQALRKKEHPSLFCCGVHELTIECEILRDLLTNETEFTQIKGSV